MRLFLGYSFESDTDTECIPLLLHYIWKQSEDKEELTLVNLVEKVMTQLEGTFAIVVKSAIFPTQLVAARRGSPLLLGVKSSSSATLDHIPVYNQQMKSGNRGHLLKTGQLAGGRKGFGKKV